MRKRVCRLLALLFALVLLPTTARATIVVPVPSEALAEEADAVVTGRVTRIEGHWDPAQAQILTTIAIAVDEVLKGEVDDPEIEVLQPGGVVGTLGSWMQGSPEFHVGERVLVFLTEQPDGSLRVTHLYLGKYTIVNDLDTGEQLAVRDPNPAGVLVLPSPYGPVLAPGADAEVVPEMKRKIRRHALRGKPGKRLRAGRLRGQLAPATSQSTTSFKLFSDAVRWFEPDSGQVVSYKITTGGEPLAPTKGFSQIREALAAWSTVPGSALRLADGGTTSSQGILRDWISAISFRDPFNQIGSTGSGCRGVLAVGANFYDASQTRTVNGQRFYRIVEGDVVTNRGWEGCGFYENFANFAEVITHELGHTLGFDHASDRNATMYGYIHFDGRGAFLTATDQAGAVFVYPGSDSSTPPPVTLTVARLGTGSGTVGSAPAGITCGTDCAEAYPLGTVVDLTATAQTGSTFAGWAGACTGTGACRVTLDASTSVTATFTAEAGVPGPGSTGGPDLVITSLGATSATVAPGTRFTVLEVVRNAGDAAAGKSRIAYHFVTATGQRLPLQGSSGVRALTAGMEVSTKRSILVPKGTPAATYSVMACVDSTNVVQESDETNNCRTAAATFVVAPAARSK